MGGRVAAERLLAAPQDEGCPFNLPNLQEKGAVSLGGRNRWWVRGAKKKKKTISERST